VFALDGAKLLLMLDDRRVAAAGWSAANASSRACQWLSSRFELGGLPALEDGRLFLALLTGGLLVLIWARWRAAGPRRGLLVHADCCCCRPACSRRCTTRDDERRPVCGGRRRGRSGDRSVRRWPPPRASTSSAWRWCSVSRKEKREGFVLWEKEEGEEGTVALGGKGRGIRKRMFHVVWAPFVRPAS
jgi:hypothetical protein